VRGQQQNEDVVVLVHALAKELQRGATDAMWRSLAALDTYRKRFEDTPDTLTNAILLGSLLIPLGYSLRSLLPVFGTEEDRKKEPRLAIGMLPLARRDVERLRQILALQQRLMDMNLSPRAKRALMHRGPFREAMTWLEIHGGAPEVIEHWRGFIEAAGAYEGDAQGAERPPRRRRRRRRRRARSTPPS